ncbi:hypothetical protein J2X07_002451 [Fictibacillus barbaricus]|uniref:Uncharacterized protein n=1 Tax=Fictibacillus barbaricus TaxID=182136 RepID=A0ABU1U1V0_9BACL|nr:hypothetical protein [Fictibacillus barbaricus]
MIFRLAFYFVFPKWTPLLRMTFLFIDMLFWFVRVDLLSERALFLSEEVMFLFVNVLLYYSLFSSKGIRIPASLRLEESEHSETEINYF